MSIFSKKTVEQEKTVQDLIESYGGNVNIEDKEKKLVEDLFNIFSRRDLVESVRRSNAKAKVDAYTDELVEILLTDETVVKVIKGSNNTAKNIAQFFAGKFRRR